VLFENISRENIYHLDAKISKKLLLVA